MEESDIEIQDLCDDVPLERGGLSDSKVKCIKRLRLEQNDITSPLNRFHSHRTGEWLRPPTAELVLSPQGQLTPFRLRSFGRNS